MIVHKAVGITGIIVDAKEERVKEYYKKYNFIPLPDILLTLFLPIKSILEAFQIISE
ncbi:MAG: hypothetical protein K8R67_13840 [Desulfobacteraceae bacterium]|nr:hypothetical protein [Desulfobacteraceae bacterium]